ncbi:MAG: hypothetical protein A2Y93_13800 [Chloroflexi bacterium RBG_13_68_17]|nr:MAG: hypothetical protein A2Y93_13800 [Chloroflexi bacterium RBG_13_68_17]
MSSTSLRLTGRWPAFARTLIQLLIPIVLVLTNVRLLMTDAFVRLEYSMPGFPTDSYGFSKEDRLHWAPIARAYLLNDAGTEFLADLRFESGEPVYNERELRHMDDVKRLTQAALRLWAACLATVLLLLVGLWWRGRRQDALRGLSGGGRLTLGGMVLLGAGLVFTFSTVFVGFHRLFFEGDTWLFYYSDTLIRLFPERFWRDVFLLLAGATLAEAVALHLLATRRLRADLARPGRGAPRPEAGNTP